MSGARARRRSRCPRTFYVVREWDTKRVICFGDSMFCADALGLKETAFIYEARTGSSGNYSKSMVVERYPGRLYEVTKDGEPFGKFGSMAQVCEAVGMSLGGVQYALNKGIATKAGYRIKRIELPEWRAGNSLERFRDAKLRRRSIASRGGRPPIRKAKAAGEAGDL